MCIRDSRNIFASRRDDDFFIFVNDPDDVCRLLVATRVLTQQKQKSENERENQCSFHLNARVYLQWSASPFCAFFCAGLFPLDSTLERERKRTTKKTSVVVVVVVVVVVRFLVQGGQKKKKIPFLSLPCFSFFCRLKKKKGLDFLAQSKKIYRKRTFWGVGRVDPNKLISFRSVVFAEEKIGESTRHHFVAFASKSTRTRER